MKKFAVAVLGSLPCSYDICVTSLNAHEAKDLEWESVKGLLIEEFMKRKEKKGPNMGNDALLTHVKKIRDK